MVEAPRDEVKHRPFLASWPRSSERGAHGCRGDGRLPTNSALIDKARVIPGINDDYLDAAPDLGALECGVEATRIVVAANGVAIDWHVGAFGHYQLQSTSDLSPPTWNAAGEPVQAERTRLQITDPTPTGAQRFYRLQHVAP